MHQVFTDLIHRGGVKDKWIVRILRGGVIGVVIFVILVAVFPRPSYVGYRHESPFEEAHARAIHSFVSSRGFGPSRMIRKEYWNDQSVVVNGKVYGVQAVQLIGATEEDGPRYYESHFEPPRKEEVADAPYRALTGQELEILKKLGRREVSFVVEEVEYADVYVDTRVIAPMFAQESCLKCHEAEVGDLLRAFDYRLSHWDD